MKQLIRYFGQIKKVFRQCGHGMAFFSFSTTDKSARRDDYGFVRGYYASEFLYEGLICTIEGCYSRENDRFLVSDIKPSFKYREDKMKILADKVPGVGNRKAWDIFDIVKRSADGGKVVVEDALKKEYPSMTASSVSKILRIFGIHDSGFDLLCRMLFPFKVPYDTIYAIYDDLGPDAARIVLRHPYRMVKYGVPVWISEKYACRGGMNFCDMERISGLVQAAMRSLTKEGYTMCPWEELFSEINYYSRKYEYMTDDVPGVLVTTAVCYDPTLCWDEHGVSYRRIYEMEKSIGEECRILARGKDPEPVYESDIDDTEEAIGVRYSEGQRKAFSLIEKPGVSILTGGPGTGKTTVVRGLIDRYEQNNPDSKVALCAPTGKAAKRLSELTGRPAKTIHKLIDYRPFGYDGDAIYKDRMHPVDADLVICDEGSMVDVKLFYMLIQALRPGTTVIICGDEDQLPSVGPGSVLHDLIASGEFSYCRLTANFRQAKGGTILKNARDKILKGLFPENSADFHLIRAATEQSAFTAVTKLAAAFYSDDDPFATQVIEPSYKGAAGVDAVNDRMREILKRDPSKRISYKDKIMFTCTNYRLGYVNGQMGIVGYMDDRDVIIKTDGKELCLPRSALNDIVPAYSYTIHKAQGSEADRVIIYLPEDPDVMLQRSLLYTAVTRARKEVYIIYVGDSLRKAVTHDVMRDRKTRLTQLVKRGFREAGAG